MLRHGCLQQEAANDRTVRHLHRDGNKNRKDYWWYVLMEFILSEDYLYYRPPFISLYVANQYELQCTLNF